MSVETRNITKLFGKQRAVDNVSFSIKKGELVGFLGPNGAGKSTIMKIITGFLPPDSGDLHINGQKVSPNDLAVKKIIGYLPEHNPLYTDLYVKESLEITAGFYNISNRKKKVGEMVEITGLAREQHKKIGALSKGFRQRVGLAQALIHDPEILILDEPTTGLDPNQLEEMRNLIKTISRNKTVMLSSHIMQEVEAMCNRVIIINQGRIVAEGDMEDIKTGQVNTGQVVEAEFDASLDKVEILSLEGVQNVSLEKNRWTIIADGKKDIRKTIFQLAVKKGINLLTLKEKQQNLEQVFQELTK